MKLIKVLYVVENLQAKGGIQTFAQTTAEELEGMYTIKLAPWHSPLSLFQRGIVFLSPTLLGSWLYTRFLQSHTQIVREDKYDVIHFWNIKTAMAIAGKTKIPFIVTCHGFEIMQPNIARFQIKLFLKTLEDASAITTPSHYTKNYLIKYYGVDAEKIFVIYPSISIPKTIIQHKSTQEIKTIGTLTRIGGRKNVTNVVKALKLLQAQGIEFRFILAGTGPSSAVKPVIAELKNSTLNWRYLGKVTDSKKWSDFYPSLDVFVLAPVETNRDVEGFGIVFLEANAYGIPVVASNTGGISDAVKEGISGLFSDPNNPNDIAEKINILLTSNKNYRESASRWAKKFNPRKTATQFQQLYSKITTT